MSRLSLPRPLRVQFIVGQNFAANDACISTDGKNTVTNKNGVCIDGSVDLYKSAGMIGHNGLDLPALRGTPIFASTEGLVEELSLEPARGLGIGIISEQTYQFADHTGGIAEVGGEHHVKVRYWHLQIILVKLGQRVKVGDLIGLVDNTGYSSGDHLHFEVKPVDFDATNNWWTNTFQNNGYFGAVDPFVYMSGFTAFEMNDFLARIRIQVYMLKLQVEAFIKK